MDHTEDRPAPPPRSRGRFQFSLRTLFVITTLLAALLSGLLAGPAWLTALTGLVVIVAVPVSLATVTVYGRGYQRTFCLGALLPAVMVFFGFSPYPPLLLLYSLFEESEGEFPLQCTVFVGFWIVAVLASGLLAMAVRRIVEPTARGEPREISSGPAAYDRASPSVFDETDSPDQP